MQHLANLLAEYAVQDFATLAKRTRRNAILYALAGVLALSAYAAALVGGGIYLSALFGPATAALLIAVGTLTIAVTIMVVVLVLNRMDRRHHADKALAASAALTVLPHLNRSDGLALAAAGGLGYLALQFLDGDAEP